MRKGQTKEDICLECPLADCNEADPRCPLSLQTTLQQDKAKERKRRFYQRHRETELAKSAKRYQAHREEVREYNKQYYQEHREAILRKKREQYREQTRK